MKNLFERIGGKSAVEAAVDIFYTKVLADDRIKHFFANTNMDDMRNHQKMFLTYAFGGIPSYPGKSLREAHSHLVRDLGLSDVHFNAVAENLVASLQELHVPEPLISEVVAIVESTRADILHGW